MQSDPSAHTSLKADVASSGVAAPTSERKRVVSEIAFPYGDLDSAVEIAMAVHHHFGYHCETDQLAAQLGTEPKHGSFRGNLATARIFGAVEVGRGTVDLTELGAQLADEQHEREARVEAFLRVPLYERLYDVYKGRRLPGDKGLEHQMMQLGVSPKQLSKARTAFQKSAEQAGFFAHGTDRLVRPSNAPGSSATLAEHEAAPAKERPTPSVDTIGTDDLHPLLVGLIKTIPREGEPFSSRRQRQWIEAAKVNFALIFGSDDDETQTNGPQDRDEVR